MRIDDLKVTAEQNKKFKCFFDLLVETNKNFNLTAITEYEEVVEKHFFDSIAAQNELSQNATVVDVGAGAGFPGVPLKIVRDDLNFTLVDSLSKRINFLNETIKQLCLNNFFAVHMRVEDFAKSNKEKFDYAIARAVASLPTLCEYLAPLIKVGGKIIAYKGSAFEDEIKQSKNAFKELNLKLEKTVVYELPKSKAKHSLIIIKKISPTNLKYPRSQNKPKTHPL